MDHSVIYSLEGHNARYGICQHSCIDGIWTEFKNCCCGSDNDRAWYNCGDPSGFPICGQDLEGLMIYTNCYPINK
jgi:hypothetical protein